MEIERPNISNPETEESAVKETRPENKEQLEESLNIEYEHIISDHNPVDFGKEGLIYRMASRELEDQQKKVFTEAGIEVENDKAVKVLKVYNKGKAEHEYSFQMRAYSLIEQEIAKGRKDLARVPKPIDFRKIKISEETKKRLNLTGASLKATEVEVIMMDYIEGNDFLELFYKWIISHAPADKEYAALDVDKASFDQLQRAALAVMGMESYLPHGHGIDQEIEKRREKIYSYLRRTGFTVGQTVVDQIKNTRKLLGDKGISHNDEHERNFMLEGDQVFLIDFARAASSRPDDEVDFRIEHELEKMTEGYEAKSKAEEKKLMFERIAALSGNKSLPLKFKSIYEASTKDSIQLNRALLARSEAATSTESGMEDFLGVVMDLVKNEKLSKEQAQSVIFHMKDSLKKPVYTRGKVTGFSIRNESNYRKLDSYKELFQ